MDSLIDERLSPSKKREDWIYLVGYSMVLFRAFINSTTFHWIMPGSLGTAIRLLGYILLFVHFIRTRRVTISLFYIGIAMLGISVLSLYGSGYSVLLDYAFCCVFAIGVSFEKITKVYISLSISMTAITIIAALLGIIENYVYYRRPTGDIRLSLGFIYPTNFAAHVFFIMLGIIFLIYDRFNYKHVFVYAIVALIIYRLTNARGPSSMIVILAIVVYAYKTLGDKGVKAIPDWMLKYASVLSAILTFVMIHFYNSNSAFWNMINSFTTNRLVYAKNTMLSHGITILGQYIEQRGDGNGGRTAGEAYTYIDLSFQRILLMYGVLLFAFLLAYSILLYNKSVKSSNVTIPLLMLIVAFYSLTAQHYFDFSYNFLLLAYFAVIPSQGHVVVRKSRRIRFNA